MTRMLSRRDDVFAASVEETTLLLNATTGRYHGLNTVGARIWELLEHPIEQEQLVARLLEEFEVAPEICEAEVEAFLAGLQARGLLVVN